MIHDTQGRTACLRQSSPLLQQSYVTCVYAYNTMQVAVQKVAVGERARCGQARYTLPVFTGRIHAV